MVRVTFLHPDLGIGGAERLVVDAALALKSKGHEVNFVTCHHDPEHCFAETKDGSLPVTVVADHYLPRHIFGRFFALCAYLRMIFAALHIILFAPHLPDVVFCDLVSACVPILKLRVRRVLFYCHYPDQLLSQPGSSLKALYRRPLNYVEQLTTGQADQVFVNSRFTQQVFYKTFPDLKHVKTHVLYPSINTDFFDNTPTLELEDVLGGKKLPQGSRFVLSINRYERKKNIELAIKSLADSRIDATTFLVVTGGYDSRVNENVEYHQELVEIAHNLGLEDRVCFLRSLSDSGKLSLLQMCTALLYTPANEHFGIVPVEAMYFGKPVIAHNSGGPRETIVNGETGFLADSESEFADKLVEVLSLDPEIREQMGRAGKRRFHERFSFQAFTEHLNQFVMEMTDETDKKSD